MSPVEKIMRKDGRKYKQGYEEKKEKKLGHKWRERNTSGLGSKSGRRRSLSRSLDLLGGAAAIVVGECIRGANLFEEY